MKAEDQHAFSRVTFRDFTEFSRANPLVKFPTKGVTELFTIDGLPAAIKTVSQNDYRIRRDLLSRES